MSCKNCLLLGTLMFLVGYALTGGLFYSHGLGSTDYSFVEQSFRFCTLNIAMMAFGLFLIIRQIRLSRTWIYRIVKDYAAMSYGIYLAHLFILGFMYEIFSSFCGTVGTIFCCVVTTALISWLLIKLLSYLPGSKFFAGASS